ncbi:MULTISPECIES: response regulator [Anaeromyxobacter]|uniref:response regulator n=1 Tax=Anaeromyxobacter TaxID=161492 RepID=UPI001F56EE69|nr:MULTISPECIES: response regulator [unclassified Anaeromyxobacter]
MSRTGDILIARGLATRDRLIEAQREGRARREPICSRLLATGVPEGALASVLSEKHGVPGVDLSRTAIALPVLDVVPRSVAEGDLILPLSLEGGRLHLAMAQPADERVLSEVRFVTGREVSPYVAVRAALTRAIQEGYDCREKGEPLWCGADAGPGGPFLAAVVPGGDLVEAELVDDLPPGSADPLAADVSVEVELDVAPPRPARADARRLVLVVDDEPEIRQLVERTLTAKGYAVETAADGAEALDKAERLLPDLVLLDAMLPRVHGFEACRRLKAGTHTRNIPVVMMTAVYRGWRFAEDAREAYGAEDYVEKPFRIDDLLRRVEAALDAGAARAPAVAAPASPQLARGRELLSAGHAAEAIAVLHEAVREAPFSAEAHHLLGRAFRARGEHFRAMTELERAVELRPGHLAALRTLAALYEETGFRRKAAEALERALPAAPDDAARGAIRRDLLRLL